MRRQLALLCGTVAALVVFTAWGGAGASRVQGVESAGIGPSESEVRVKGDIDGVRVVQRRHESGQLIADVFVQNDDADETCRVEVRVTFFDADGQILETTPWTPTVVDPETEELVRLSSVSSDPATMRVEVRAPDED